MACAVCCFLPGVSPSLGREQSSSGKSTFAGKGLRAKGCRHTTRPLERLRSDRKELPCEGFCKTIPSWKRALTRTTKRYSATQDQTGTLPDDMDSKFVPINELEAMGEEGPPAMLLLGFSSGEVATVMEMLREMDGDFMKILCCTEEMLKGTLEQAMNTVQKDPLALKVAEDVPRVCFLSGLTSEEILMVIDAYEQIDLELPAFAAMVPMNKNKMMEELIAEVMGDHDKLTSKAG